MNASAWLDSVDDRLNPVLVKEARQLVRSRAVVGCQWAMLAVVPAAMGLVQLWANAPSAAADDGRAVGLRMFAVCQGILALVCLYGVPLYVGVRMAAERTSQEGMDMLRFTGVSAQKIILGKWCSGLMVALLAGSACAPFIAACYFFRGVGVGMMLVALLTDLVLASVTAQIGLFIGALGSGWGLKILGAVLFVLLSPCVACMTGSSVFTANFGGMAAIGIFVVVLAFGGAVAWAVFYGLAVVSLHASLRASRAGRGAVHSAWQADPAPEIPPASSPVSP